jgi:tRNA threonylcarbamoyladenosine biosynthesis protein TsaB
VKLLALDTATDWCSVALWVNGECQARQVQAERGHGGHVLGLVDELLGSAGMGLGALDAIAFGRGPGAFTGLRLAASITQGLAYAASLPVIPVSDLRALAQQVMAPPPGAARVLVCHDARMGEVYWAGFERVEGHAREATPEAVSRPELMLDAARAWLGATPAWGAGSGFAQYPALAALAAPQLVVAAGLWPRAQEIAMLAAHDGLASALAPEQAVPVYVRNNVALLPAARPGKP